MGQRSFTAPFAEAGIPAERNRILADETCAVQGVSGVFSGGDCVTGPSTAINAIAAGQVAAFNIDEYLGYHHKVKSEVKIPEAYPNPCIPTGRANIRSVDPVVRQTNFEDVEIGMTPEEALRESGRCLRCDCFGCGSLEGGSGVC